MWYRGPTGLLGQEPSVGNLDWVGDHLSTIQNSGIDRRYVYAPGEDTPLVWYEGSDTTDRRWLHTDERGSVIAVSDGSGNPLAINRYDEYGQPAAGNLGRFGYTGQQWIAGLGLWDYKARMYSPALGRFMQTDPIGYGDGLNWYGYVGGDPVNWVDPSGLDSEAPTPPDFGSLPDCKEVPRGLTGPCTNTATVTGSLFNEQFNQGSLGLPSGGLFSSDGAALAAGVGGTSAATPGAAPPQNHILNHDIGADIVVVARKVPKPVEDFISDYVINYDCFFISSAKCGASDYVSAGLLLTGVGVAENTAIEGASKGFAKHGIGRAGQVRFLKPPYYKARCEQAYHASLR